MNILVTGASSQIGQCLLPMLAENRYVYRSVSRKKHKHCTDVDWVQADMTKDMSHIWRENNANIWIHLGFLPLAMPHLKAASEAGVRRFIAFSSTSIFTKKDSKSADEYQTIQSLMDAEEVLLSNAQNIAWTLFRPTMIYGCGADQNIAFIQKTIKRFGIFPIAGGKGLRQPVHAEDLALACISALHKQNTKNKAYNLSGGEILAYREMVERIFTSLQRTPRIFNINPMIYKAMIITLKKISSRYSFVQTSMIDRMNMDMVFDCGDAARDFAYKPRSFQP